jgi:peptidoglycan hydrolase CwlO-like protein
MSNNPQNPRATAPIMEDSVADQLRNLRAQIASLERELQDYRADAERADTAEAKEDAREERREKRRENEQRRSKEALDRARAEAIRAVARLLPEAIAQAKGTPARKGKPATPPRPALLRMILRATR